MRLIDEEDFTRAVREVLQEKFAEIANLSDSQQALFNFMNGKDVLTVRPTGHGKSLVFQMVSAVMRILKTKG